MADRAGCVAGRGFGERRVSRDTRGSRDGLASREVRRSREVLSSHGRKGFTLMELLIVVAIIAVLVAIAIPLFTSQLERSREATDLANVRSAYAEVMTAVLTDDATAEHDGVTMKQGDGSFRAMVPLRQQVDDWQTDPSTLNIAGLAPGHRNWRGTPAANGQCAVVYDPNTDEVFLDWSGVGSIFDLSTKEGREAADNALQLAAVNLLLNLSAEDIAALPMRKVRKTGTLYSSEFASRDDNWYVWYYDPAANCLVYDYEDLNAHNAAFADLDGNSYGYAHRNQYVTVALSEDGNTTLVGWTRYGINNTGIDWWEYDATQGVVIR